MQPRFPCPNPTCAHTFTPDAVKDAANLVCPRCGTVFQFRPAPGRQAPPAKPVPPSKPASTAAPPPRPAPAAKVPPPPPPKARPVTAPPQPKTRPAVPLAMPVEVAPAPAGLNFQSQADVVVSVPARKKAGPRRRRLGPILAVAIIAVIGLGVAVWGGVWLLHLGKLEQAGEGPGHIANVFNSHFAFPGKPWRRDESIETRMHVNLGLRSTSRACAMSLFLKDYKTRTPGEAELVDEALQKLRAYFGGLEWEKRSGDEAATLGGHPAHVLDFEGDDAESVRMAGECCCLTFRGYGYWFFTWGPVADKDELRPEWELLRQRFTVKDGRKGWTERPRESEKVQGKKARYRLSYVKGLWKPRNAEDYDPLADLVLLGDEPEPGRMRHEGKAALFQVLLLPKEPDLKAAAAAARQHLLKRQQEDYPKTTIEPIKDKNGAEIDRGGEVGDARGHLSKLRVVNAEERERFVVLAAVNRPEGVLVLQGDCDWGRRDFWEQEFTPLLKSLKLR